MGFPLAVSVLLDTTNGHHHSSTVVQMPRYARRRRGAYNPVSLLYSIRTRDMATVEICHRLVCGG